MTGPEIGGVVITVLCFVAAITAAFWPRRKTRRQLAAEVKRLEADLRAANVVIAHRDMRIEILLAEIKDLKVARGELIEICNTQEGRIDRQMGLRKEAEADRNKVNRKWVQDTEALMALGQEKDERVAQLLVERGDTAKVRSDSEAMISGLRSALGRAENERKDASVARDALARVLVGVQEKRDTLKEALAAEVEETRRIAELEDDQKARDAILPLVDAYAAGAELEDDQKMLDDIAQLETQLDMQTSETNACLEHIEELTAERDETMRRSEELLHANERAEKRIEQLKAAGVQCGYDDAARSDGFLKDIGALNSKIASLVLEMRLAEAKIRELKAHALLTNVSSRASTEDA